MRVPNIEVTTGRRNSPCSHVTSGFVGSEHVYNSRLDEMLILKLNIKLHYNTQARMQFSQTIVFCKRKENRHPMLKDNITAGEGFESIIRAEFRIKRFKG